MKFLRKTIRSMQGYVPGEQPRDRRHVKLNTNENPYPPSPSVEVALQEAIGDRLRLYPMPMADDARKRAARLWRVRPENVLVGNGSDDILGMIARATIEPGVRVAYPVPTYTLYDTLVEMYGGTSVRIPFGADFGLPEALVDVEASVIFLANPNSPSGTAIAPEDVRRLLGNADRLVVVDEAYVDFADRDCLGLLAEHPNLLVLRTLSKSYSLAGMRIGFALGSEELLTELAKVKDSYNVSRLGIVAAAAALADVRSMHANCRRVLESRAWLAPALEGLGFEVLPSQANFVLARRPGKELGDLVEALSRRGVLVRYFDREGLRDAMRVTIGTDEELRVFLRVLRQLLERAGWIDRGSSLSAREAEGHDPEMDDLAVDELSAVDEESGVDEASEEG